MELGDSFQKKARVEMMKKAVIKPVAAIAVCIVVALVGFVYVWQPFWNHTLYPALADGFAEGLALRDGGREIFAPIYVENHFMEVYELYFVPEGGEEKQPKELLLSLITSEAYYVNEETQERWFFAVSPDGYAVIESEGLRCRVLQCAETWKDYSRKIQEEKLVYLTSFGEFSEWEQSVLRELEENPCWRYVWEENSRRYHRIEMAKE